MSVRGKIDKKSVRLGAKSLEEVFTQLTPKQVVVLNSISKSKSSKEIAWDIGISESAVNQRIQSVRLQLDLMPRAKLAQNYREFLQRKGQ